MTNEDELIDHCYANLATMSDEDLGTTALLAFHNDTVNDCPARSCDVFLEKKLCFTRQTPLTPLLPTS